jgi:hypothetical protein
MMVSAAALSAPVAYATRSTAQTCGITRNTSGSVVWRRCAETNTWRRDWYPLGLPDLRLWLPGTLETSEWIFLGQQIR